MRRHDEQQDDCLADFDDFLSDTTEDDLGGICKGVYCWVVLLELAYYEAGIGLTVGQCMIQAIETMESIPQ